MKNAINRILSITLCMGMTLGHSLPLLAQGPPDFPRAQANEERRDSLAPDYGLSNPMAGEVLRDPRITLELKGVDVLDVLKILTKRSNLNIVAGKNVRGQVTMYLKDVPIRDALDTIVDSLELAYVEEKDIVTVMTAKEYEDKFGKVFSDDYSTRTIAIQHASPEAVREVVNQLKGPKGKFVFDERTSKLVISDRGEAVMAIEAALRQVDQPLVTKIFKLKYAAVSDIEEQLQDYITPESGVLKMDKRTNQLAVTDREEKVEQVGRVLESLDIQPSQVLIEARIVEVDLFDAFRYGIDWNYVRLHLTDRLDEVNFQPNFDVSAPGSALGSGTLSTFTVKEAIDGVDAVFQLLQNVGKTNTLSAPRITVLNNEEAKLVDATRQPYVSQTVVQGDTTSQTADDVQFVEVGVSLSVVPTIADDQRVVLKLKPEISAQNGTLDVKSVSQSSETEFTRSEIPIISSQTLETTVIVKSGHTLVVGGLIKDSESKTRRKLPILSDIPILGAAFRSESIDFHKTELVIFLTPHIISGDRSSAEFPKYFNGDQQLIDFDLVGGYDYQKALKHSQGPFREDRNPYWKMERGDWPNYFQPRKLYERAAPYEGRMSEFEGFEEGRDLFEQAAFREAYRNQLAFQIRERLEPLKKYHKRWGKIDLGVVVANDGRIQDLSLLDYGNMKSEDERRLALRTIHEGGSFQNFPEPMTSASEIFDIRIKFKK